MRKALVFWTMAALLGGCPAGSTTTPPPRESPYFHDWLTEAVFAAPPVRSGVANAVEAPAEGRLRTAEPPSDPGAIDVLIGSAGDGRELTPEQERLAERGDDEFAKWELDLARWTIRRAGVVERVPSSWPRRRPGPADVVQLVIDSPYQSWADLGSYAHLVAFGPGWEPATGADVYLDGKRIGRTDDTGSFAFRRRPDAERTEEQGRITVVAGRRARSFEYHSFRRTQSFAFPVLYLQTDRGTYLPGDTVHVRALGWQLRGDYAPLADAQAELNLLSPEGRLVGGGALRTDSWGVATLDLPIPAHAPQGYYRLEARYAEESAEASLRITDFVPPELEIRHDLGHYLTPDTTEVPFEVRLGYFGGGTFREGTIRVAVRAQGHDEPPELHVEERTVEGPGPHRFVLPSSAVQALAGRFAGEDGAAWPYAEVSIRVTDSWGRSDTVRRQLAWVVNPYTATIELDREQYAPGQPVNAMVRVVDLADEPQRGLEVRLERPEFGEPLTTRTDEGGVAVFRFPAPAAPAAEDDPVESEEPEDAAEAEELDPWDLLYAVSEQDHWNETQYFDLRAFLPNVREAAAETSFEVAPPLPLRSAVPDTNVVERRDVALEVLFPGDVEPAEEVVHADLTDSSGSLVHSFLIPVTREGGKPIARGTFQVPTWGSALLSLFCLGRQGAEVGLLTDGQNLVVRAQRELTVTLHGLPERAEPGGRLEVEVQVTGPAGETRDAVAGVAVVDDAVLSLGDPLGRSPVDRFYNPDLRVLATTGAQTLTWPVVQRTWGPDTYDIGWPPVFGWHSGRPSTDALFQAIAELPQMEGRGFGRGDVGQMGHGYGSGRGTGVLRARLVLRTKFEPTSLWLPRLELPGGRGSFSAELSDAITVQNVSVVASDRQGGIGVARAEVPVRQELYVRADVPAALTEGDKLEVPVAVRNLTDEPQEVRVAFSSFDFPVWGEPETLTVGAGETGVARFTIEAIRPGTASWKASAETARLQDVESRLVLVRPRGEPATELIEGTASRDAPFRTTLKLDLADRWHAVRLGVTMPSVVPALQDLDRLIGAGYYGTDPAASGVVGATAVLRYLRATGAGTSDDARRIETWLAELAAAIQLAQNDNGGWNWFWSRETNPFVTAHALDALLELRALGFPVLQDVLERAVAYFAAARQADGLYLADAIALWEGADDRVRRSVTAYVFEVLTRVLGTEVEGALRQHAALGDLLRGLAETLAPELQSARPDPLVTAHVVLGLGRLLRNGMEDEVAVAPNLVSAVAEGKRRLARIEDLAHWEPGWYDAWGGRVEAAYALLQVTRELEDDGAWEAARRKAIEFLLATRPAWGAWHNHRGTAYAVRALMLLEPAPAGEGGTVLVKLDGTVLHRISTSADDLFAAALALRDIELGTLPPGEHTLEVSYDGSLKARVALAVDRWTGAGETTAVPSSASGSIGGASVEVMRDVPAEVQVGEPVVLSFDVRSRAVAGPLVLEQPVPAGTRVNRTSLASLDGVSVLADGDDGTLVLGLVAMGMVAGEGTRFEVRLDTDRAGTVEIPPAAVRSVLQPALEARSAAGTLVVR